MDINNKNSAEVEEQQTVALHSFSVIRVSLLTLKIADSTVLFTKAREEFVMHLIFAMTLDIKLDIWAGYDLRRSFAKSGGHNDDCMWAQLTQHLQHVKGHWDTLGREGFTSLWVWGYAILDFIMEITSV